MTFLDIKMEATGMTGTKNCFFFLQDQPTRLKPRDPRGQLFAATCQLDRRPECEHKTGAASTYGTGVHTSQEKLSQASTSQSVIAPHSVKHTPKRQREILSFAQDQPARGTDAMPCSFGHEQYKVKFQRIATLGDETTNHIPTLQHRHNFSHAPSLKYARIPEINQDSYMGSCLTSDEWRDVEKLAQNQGYHDPQRAFLVREREKRLKEQGDMLAAKKLSLVLNLEHILLHYSTIHKKVHSRLVYKTWRDKVIRDCKKAPRHLFNFDNPTMWIKLRPGIWNFLEKTNKLYELHLQTKWDKEVAGKVLRVLDPNGTLFAGRIVCRGRASDPFGSKATEFKKLAEVKGLESGIVILDSKEHAWPNNIRNMIAVERYKYFPKKISDSGHESASKLRCDEDESLEDGTLATYVKVLERIHHNFFAQARFNNPDVRHILASEKKTVLAGCRILFSGFFKCGEANPQDHGLWKLSEEFGAKCTVEMEKEVTHIVAKEGKGRSDKVKWGLSEGKFVVNKRWVRGSVLLYRRANEHEDQYKRLN